MKSRRGIKLLMLLGLATAMMFYTNSRTGSLAVICVVVFANVLQTVRQKRWTKAQFWQFVFPILIAVIVLIPTTLQIFRIQPIIDKAVPKIVYLTKELELNPGEKRMVDYKLGGFLYINTVKTSMSGKTADQISSGRLQIWTDYLIRLDFFGHDNHEYFEVIDVMGRKAHNSDAHMTALEMAYNYGIFGGIFFLLFNILSGFKSICYAIGHRNEKYALFPFIATIAFGVVSMLASINASINNVFYSPITLLYFLVQTPLIVKPVKKIAIEQ